MPTHIFVVTSLNKRRPNPKQDNPSGFGIVDWPADDRVQLNPDGRKLCLILRLLYGRVAFVRQCAVSGRFGELLGDPSRQQQHVVRNCEAEGFGGLYVDCELILRW
jgi:hypothetical protein